MDLHEKLEIFKTRYEGKLIKLTSYGKRYAKFVVVQGAGIKDIDFVDSSNKKRRFTKKTNLDKISVVGLICSHATVGRKKGFVTEWDMIHIKDNENPEIVTIEDFKNYVDSIEMLTDVFKNNVINEYTEELNKLKTK